MRACVVALAGLLLALPAAADEDEIAIKDGAGKDVVEANCGACHSLDYVEMNSPFLDEKKWEATVKKMVERFGAPIEEADIAAIISYLSANYGP
jgi:mono/diheme cytochrome c family protein